MHHHSDEACDAHLPTPSSKDAVIQLKVYNAPIDFWKRRYKDRPIWYKISPINMLRRDSEIAMDHYDGQESSNMNDIVEDSSVVRISVLKDGLCTPRSQEQFGHLYDPNEFVLFQTLPVDAEQMSFMVDFYLDNPSAGLPVPEHIGFSYILPSNLRGTSGSCTMPITGKKHLPIGQFSGNPPDHLHLNFASRWSTNQFPFLQLNT